MNNKNGSAVPQFKLVLIILILGVVLATLLVITRPVAEKKAVNIKPPEVTVVRAQSRDIHIPVISQGTIRAKTQIKLAAEVTGKVVWRSEELTSGSFFNKNELLLRIDDSEYKLLITRAEAQVAAAVQLLARTEAEAEQARSDLKRMGRSEKSSSAYALKVPHLKEARAKLKAAQADLEIARLQKKRCNVHAPFDGRTVKQHVDIGQFVAPGSSLAEIYATDVVEVRLPVSNSQQRLLDLNITSTGDLAVLISATIAGKQWHWQAIMSRIESVIDQRNQLLYGIAEIKQPFNSDKKFPDRPPLTPGLFVQAKIEGRLLQNAFVLPRTTLRFGDQLWLIDKDNKLYKKPVVIIHKDASSIYLVSGLNDNEQVITSALDFAVDGMKLSPLEEKLEHSIEVVQ